MSVTYESRLVSFFIYNPELSPKEGTEHLKILFYYPDGETQNRMVRNIGLCEALVNFTRSFNPKRPCEAVHTQRLRQVFIEPEPNIWVVMTVSVPWGEAINNGEKTVEYYDGYVQDCLIEAALIKAYATFKLFNGSFANISRQFGVDGLRSRMDRFFTRYMQTIKVDKWSIFDVFQGIQFLPLDKYIYLKVHCFINQVETAFRNVQRTVLLYNDQLIWSGLEQEDIKVFYQYLLSWLFPSQQMDFSTYSAPPPNTTSSMHQSPPTSGAQSVTQSVMSSIRTPTTPHTGSFVIGQLGVNAGNSIGVSGASEVGRSPWVYISVDGMLQSYRLYVYSAGNVTMCFFVQGDKVSPQDDFCKRLSTYLGPRLAQISQEITDFKDKSKSTQSIEQQYRFVYFNEMNLAVKSPLLSKRPPHLTISSDAMRLLIEINTEYNSIDEGETVARTFSDYWVVCRKSGHRRFFVLLNQKNANFAEVTDEVRRLCQKEFTNIFFFD